MNSQQVSMQYRITDPMFYQAPKANSSASVAHGSGGQRVVPEQMMRAIEACLRGDDEQDESLPHHFQITQRLFPKWIEKKDSLRLKKREKRRKIERASDEKFVTGSAFAIYHWLKNDTEADLKEHLKILKRTKLIGPDKYARLTAIINANTDLEVCCQHNP